MQNTPFFQSKFCVTIARKTVWAWLCNILFLSLISLLAAAPFAHAQNLTESVAEEISEVAQAVPPVSGETRKYSGADNGKPIEDIKILGFERIDPATVLSYLTFEAGDKVSEDDLDQSLKNLFATGLFADIQLEFKGQVLNVKVTENPIINRVAFEGNKRLKDEALSTEIQLKPRVVYTRSKVQQDVDRIVQLYRRNGRFAAKVEPKVVFLEQNRLDLVFEITEGPKSKIRDIQFIGNRKFEDTRLKEVLLTKENRFYRFLTTADTYDPDRLLADQDNLRKFYLSKGYADFQVASAVTELTPDGKEFFLVITLEEGDRYNVVKVTVESAIKDLDLEPLKAVITTISGEIYNADLVEKTVLAMVEAAENQQFAFVDIVPDIKRDKQAKTLNIIYKVGEGTRTFVGNINIEGNTRTIDEIIRRRLLVSEGDPFNRTKIRESREKVRNLDYFETVDIETTPSENPDIADVTVKVEEKSTGELSVGAGFSSVDGPLADFRVREKNFLGLGKDLLAAATVSARSRELEFSYTEPYFLGYDVRAGFDVFNTTQDFQDESSFNERETGFGFKASFPLAEYLNQSVNYRFARNEIENVSSTASRFIREQEGTTNTSLIGQDLVYDRRDSAVSPSSGFLLNFGNQFAGLGGDVKYFRTVAGASYFYPITEKVIFNAATEAGTILGINDDVRINNRFFLGGNSLRGFATAGIGPRDIATDDALGGNNFVRGTFEVSFPLSYPRDLGLSGHLFTDWGTLWDIDLINSAIAGEVVDENSIRASAGFGIGWASPVGPVRVDFANPFLKEEFDDTEFFKFSFGTKF